MVRPFFVVRIWALVLLLLLLLSELFKRCNPFA